MVDIGNIGGALPGRPVRNGEQGAKPPSVARPAGESAGDRVEISDGARKAQELAALAQKARQAPEVRDAVVAEVQEQISTGELLREEIARQIASRIVDAIL